MTHSLQQRWQAVMMDNYGTPPLALASGDGAVVTDVDGKSYLDLLGGIAVNVLGHRHPAVIEAVTRQLDTLGHTSNLYVTEPGLALAETLVALLGADAETRVFFCNSGAEANEVAFKISRLTGRTKIVAAQEAFHGRTMGALALTGQPSKQAPFAPLPGDVTHVPYGDIDELAAAVVRVTPLRCSSNRSWGRAAWSCRPRDTWSPRAKSPPDTARCWCSTRCRPEWAVPVHFSRTSTTASPRTW